MSATTPLSSTNAPEWSVSELSGALKRTLESEFGFVRVRAEISGYRGPHASGHAYFTLKDQGAKIDAVVWRTAFARLRVKPTEGLEVVVTGRITTFPSKSAYQIVVDSIEPAGIGALMAVLEERRKALTTEGLFDQARKRPLPYLPRIVGVVTSPSGAVIRDILHRLAERFPSHVLVWPVRVQGEGSAAEIIRAIEGFNALPFRSIARPEVLIVARGGGSLEDLWSFNEEAVVRAVAASALPIIAAVGHETDWTLIDFAADLRAPTPTAAAEKCVPVRSELLMRLGDLERRTTSAAGRVLLRARTEFRSAARALPAGDRVIDAARQRFDAAVSQTERCMTRRLHERRLLLGKLADKLMMQAPNLRLARASARVETLEDRLRRALRVGDDRRRQRSAVAGARLRAAFSALARQELRSARAGLENVGRRLRPAVSAGLSARTARLGASGQLLASLGYRNVLARGFVLARDVTGAPVRSAEGLRNGTRLELEFADGSVHANVSDALERSPPTRPRAARIKPDGSTQGILF